MNEHDKEPREEPTLKRRRPPLLGRLDGIVLWDNLDMSVMPDFNGSLDPDGRFAAWNAAMSRLHEKADR